MGDMQLNATANFEASEDKNGLVFISFTEFIDEAQSEKNPQHQQAQIAHR